MEGVTAAVLAGGLGTRLRSVVADRPKVLAEVAGRPFLAYLLDQLAAAGVRETVLLVGYGAAQVRAAAGEVHAGMRLTYSAESQPLGTGGAVRLALPAFRGESILLLNGDSCCDVDLAAFCAERREKPGGAGMVLAQVADVSRYGRVETAADGRVLRFEEKGGEPFAGRINAGIYLIPKVLVAGIPAARVVSLEREMLPAWVSRGKVWGFPGGRFIDIGTPASYADAEAFFRQPGRG
jgi:D-glycero-alpha-D-manno-heptose 1-phosphate guanylyltransferase